MDNAMFAYINGSYMSRVYTQIDSPEGSTEGELWCQRMPCSL